jgi:Peptidase family M23
VSSGGCCSFFHPSGLAYSDHRLVALAVRLRGLGLSQRQIITRVYVPFILAGPADWSDSWHALRYGPAAGEVRLHEGQDVFCDYGDPVLATKRGWVDYEHGGLGGTVARLHVASGSYFYYAHLSATNAKRYPTGTRVRPGDILGYCGNSGDAAGGPPHVHFGWYLEGGSDPRDPMKLLVRWLHRAERRALGLAAKTQGERVGQIPSLILQRQFGEAFEPDLSRLRGQQMTALWWLGSYPVESVLRYLPLWPIAANSDELGAGRAEAHSSQISGGRNRPGQGASANDRSRPDETGPPQASRSAKPGR